MAWDGVLVRFGEIGIKSPPVRRRMLDRLRQNLLDLMLRGAVEGNVERQGSRLWMAGPDADRLADVATHTFGVVSASPAVVSAATIEAIGAAAAEIAMGRDWTTFAVRANRAGEHAFTSQDIGVQVGSAVYQAAEAAGRSPEVDLDDPDIEVHVDVRSEKAYVFTDKLPGPGGLPMGVQGKVVALISDPGSCVAAWLMMRRGCRVVPAHAGHAGSLPVDNLEALQAWGLGDKADLLPVCTGFVSKAALFEATQTLAKRIGAQAFVTGETLDSELVVPDGDIPVLRPLCGLDPAYVSDLAERIRLDREEPEHVLDPDSHETAESLLSMHRITEIG